MKKLTFLLALFTLLSCSFAGATDIRDSEPGTVYHINTSEDENVIIDLPVNTPVTVIDENGITSVYEYTVEPSVTRSGSLRASVSRTASSVLGDVAGNAYFTLWADATWGDRTVTIDDCGLNYSATFCIVSPDSTDVLVKTASNNKMAKVRTTGDMTFTAPGIGDWASGNYDFELWLDPANMSKHGYLKVNDNSGFFGDGN
ncbi:MAG: hypothetical protein KHY27_09525 [Butyricicoccus pullicaecorum]|nr:hypothetical protein [Butyricicoccus pullicaecorum]